MASPGRERGILKDDAPLRADARRNRERILAAAEEVFLEQGANAVLDEVARRAGVGVATLYRRFPTREDLLAATYSARFTTFAENSRRRAAELDPVSALRAYLEELVLHTNVYRGLATSLGTVLRVGTQGCVATSEEGQRLLHRAQEAGGVRAGVGFDDLVCIATAISLATEKLTAPKKRVAHLTGLFMDGIGAR